MWLMLGVGKGALPAFLGLWRGLVWTDFSLGKRRGTRNLQGEGKLGAALESLQGLRDLT